MIIQQSKAILRDLLRNSKFTIYQPPTNDEDDDDDDFHQNTTITASQNHPR